MRDTVSSPEGKNIPLHFGLPAAHLYVVHSTKGRIAIVTDAELDAMDAVVPQDVRHEPRTVKPCGSGSPMLESSLRLAMSAFGSTRRAGDGG
jgi:hypothetical protein